MNLSQDQVKTILNNAPAGADKKKILDGLINRGYELEGVDTAAAKQAMQPVEPSTSGGRFKKELSERSNKIGDIVTGINKETPVLQTSLDIANQIVGAPIAAAYEALPQVVQDVGARAGEIAGKGINKLTDFISDSPMLQKFVLENPDKAKQLEDVFGVIRSGSELVGSATATAGAPGVVSSTADKLTKLAGRAVKPVVKGSAKALGTGLEATGQKIQQSVIRPSGKDISDGFKIENVQKYDVGGSLPETIAKTHTKMNALTQELREKLTETDAKIDLNKVAQETIDNLTSGKTKSFGDNQAIQRVVDNLKEELSQVSEDGFVDLVDATNIKRGAGQKGAWAYNRPEMDASAIEKVYTEFYDKIKTAIEDNAPDGVKEINQQLSELIPINNAAMRRLPVADRNNALSLTDTIGLTSSIFDPRALLIMGATKASKSGRVGNLLTKAGAKLKNADPKGVNLNPDIPAMPDKLGGFVTIMGEIKDVSRLVNKSNPYSKAAAFLDDVDRKTFDTFLYNVNNKIPITKELGDNVDRLMENINKSSGQNLFNPNGTDLSKLKQISLIKDADRELTKKAISISEKTQTKKRK